MADKKPEQGNMIPAAKNYLFWFGSFALILGIVVGLSAMMSVYSSHQMILSEALGIRRVTINAVEDNLSDIALSPNLNDIRAAKVLEFFREILNDNEVLKVRIWLDNGYISKGWDGSIFFIEAKPGRKILRLMSHEKDNDYNVSSEIRYADADPGAAEGKEATRFEKKDTGPKKKHLAVFVPIYSNYSERVNYVVEVVKPAGTVLHPLKRVLAMIWLITGLGLGLYPSFLILANALYRKRKEHEIETIKSKQLEAINSMVVTLNHEINQPLTGICTYADLLKKSSGGNPDLMRFAEKIHEQSIRLSSLVKRISDIAQVEMTEYIRGTSMLDLSKSSGGDKAEQDSEEDEDQ